MSHKNAGKDRTDRNRKRKLLRRKQNQKLQQSMMVKTDLPVASNNIEDETKAVSSQLRQLAKDGQTGFGNYEIVVYKPFTA